MSAPDVALISPYPSGGEDDAGLSGVASYSSRLAHALSDRGADVVVIAPEEAHAPAVSEDGPVHVQRRWRRGAAALPAAARAARATGARIVHVQHELFLYGGPESLPGLVPALRRLRRARRGPVVTMHHVVDPAGVDRDFTRVHRVRAPVRAARAGLRAVQSAIARLSSAVVVHEPAFAPILGDAVVVPHGVPQLEPIERARARAELGLDERFLALCFGFLAPYKGLEVALAAAERAGDEILLAVVGGEHPRLADSGDPYAHELRARFEHAALFAGHAPEEDIARWYSAADVALFLYPRPFASSGPLALALGHGTPFLLSPELGASTGAPRELTVERDPDSVAARLRALASDEPALDALRAESASLAAPRAWPAVAERHLELYEEVQR